MMWWIIAACIVALAVVGILLLILVLFNRLSMARSLCDEARRQLLVEVRARHALVPPFIGSLQQTSRQDFSTLELALASAERAPFGHRGAAAENALTRAINDSFESSGLFGEDLDTTVQLLHGQLAVIAERIVAGARLYNSTVERYHRRRSRFLARPFSTVFKEREMFTESGGAVPKDMVPS